MKRPFITLALMVGIAIYFISTRMDSAEELIEPALSAPGQAQTATLTSDLRTLVNVQSMYEAIEGTFASQLTVLEFSGSAGVTVRMIEASARGFSAEATHPSDPNGSCVVFVGDVAAPSTRGGTVATAARTPVCDR